MLITCLIFWTLLSFNYLSAQSLPLSGNSAFHNTQVNLKSSAKIPNTATFKVNERIEFPAFNFRLIGGGHYQTTATCRLVGQNCYIFVEDDVWGKSRVTQADLESLAQAFDKSTPKYPNQGIFSIITDLFGPPPNVDNDPRILILILDILDSGSITGETFVGFFDTENQTPPISMEIIYIDCNPLDLDSDLARSTLAHEFQHMIHWMADPDEEKWLDEGCSEYAELACGYKDTTQTTAASFLQGITNTSLTIWEDLPFEFDQTFLWMTYFTERYGDGALTHLVSNPENGILSVNQTLESIGISHQFDTLFANWTAAIYLDGQGKFGYRQLDLDRVKRDTLSIPTIKGSRNLHLWGTEYFDIQDSPGLSVEIGSSGNGSLLVVLISVRNEQETTVTFSTPQGIQKRFNVFGPDKRALAISRTSGETLAYTFTLTPLDGNSPAASDFDKNNQVGFSDFLSFANHFGLQTGATNFDPTYDLDGDRKISFEDFLIFVKNFNKTL